jgi:hypothetical protein
VTSELGSFGSEDHRQQRQSKRVRTHNRNINLIRNTTVSLSRQTTKQTEKRDVGRSKARPPSPSFPNHHCYRAHHGRNIRQVFAHHTNHKRMHFFVYVWLLLTSLAVVLYRRVVLGEEQKHFDKDSHEKVLDMRPSEVSRPPPPSTTDGTSGR